MNNATRKKIINYVWNGLFILVILILLIPTWRVAFQSTVQRIFMTSVILKEKQDITVSIQPNEWIIYDRNNQPISFHTLRDKPIILNFWATWCPPCVAELPGLFEFYQSIKDDVYVIAVSSETLDILDKFEAFDKYPGMVYSTKHTIKQFEFSAYPTTFILAPNFRIVSKIEGAENFATEHNINFIKQLK